MKGGSKIPQKKGRTSTSRPYGFVEKREGGGGTNGGCLLKEIEKKNIRGTEY